jgi:hypothetical protein
MKKIYLQLLVLLIGIVFTFSNINASDNPVFTTSDTNNVVLETCTGTWCGYCPCGHDIISTILSIYPKTVVLCYHGPPNYGSPVDPWAGVGYPMIQLFGMNSYPTGVVSRSSGILSRGSWYSAVSGQAVTQPFVKVVLTNPTINATTRKITGTITATALQDLTGAYSIFVALTEDHIINPQNIYASCGTAGINNSYVHDHVVRAVITPTTGTQLTSGTWTTNTSFTYNLDYTVTDATISLLNCQVNMFVYKQGTPYTTGAQVQNGLGVKTTAFIATGMNNNEIISNEYSLSQNFPNPFNPVTSIRFTLPKDGNISFKIYDITGKEVSNYYNGYLNAGTYTMRFDGTNLTSGIYFYKLTTKDFSDVKRMILVK